MDEEGFLAVGDFDLGLWDTGLKVEHCVGIEPKGFEDSINFGILEEIFNYWY